MELESSSCAWERGGPTTGRKPSSVSPMGKVEACVRAGLLLAVAIALGGPVNGAQLGVRHTLTLLGKLTSDRL